MTDLYRIMKFHKLDAVLVKNFKDKEEIIHSQTNDQIAIITKDSQVYEEYQGCKFWIF